MNKLTKIIVCISVSIFILLNYNISYAYKNEDLFKDIVSLTKGEVVEYGLKSYFISNRNGQELTKYFIESAKDNKYTVIKQYKENETYYVDCKNKFKECKIKIKKLNSRSKITIKIDIKDNKNQLNELEYKVLKIAKELGYIRGEHYKYLKAKIPYDNLNNVNDKVIRELKNNGATNINSIMINNGMSTSAYTNRYKPKKNNGKLMDLNFATCKYASGKYIIIGTPEIIIPY